MYFIGIDISKYKHDCFIMNENNQVIRGSFSFDNSQEGFKTFLDVLKSLDRSQEIKIGLEATGHYGNNLKLFLNDNGYSFMEFNPLLIKRFASSHSLRRTKTDKCDASLIATILTDATIEYKPYRFSSYHIQELKSLTRERESMIKQRSLQLVHLTNILDKIFPEYKQFFNNKLSNTALFILDKFKSPSRIAKLNNHDIEIIHNYSRKIPASKIIKLKELAKNTIGNETKYNVSLLHSILNIYKSLDEEVSVLESQINEIMNQYKSPIASILGISSLSAGSLIGEFEDITIFDNPNQLTAFCGVDPSRNQSGTEDHNGHMVKHGSGHLRYVLFNVAMTVIAHNPTFYEFYRKKRSEGKCHLVALSHVVKKLIRVIFKLEKDNLMFNSNLLR